MAPLGDGRSFFMSKNEFTNPEFLTLRFNYDKEVRSFCERMQGYVQAFPTLNEAIDKIFIQIRPNGKLETTIYMLGRLCSRQFEAIFVLATMGHGTSANRLLRSLFEKAVNLHYLAQYPEFLDDFWDYYFVELHKLGLDDEAEKIDKDASTKMDRFRRPSGGFQPRWTKLDLVSQAKLIGFDEAFLRHVYQGPNGYVHTSVGEILESFVHEEDDTLSAVTEASDADRTMADMSLLAATDIVRGVIEKEVQYFALNPVSEFDGFVEEFTNILRSIRQASAQRVASQTKETQI